MLKPYFHTKRSVKTDRYYTSIELSQELEKKEFYTTGTVMANRVAKELRWTAKVSRDKERGQFEKHLYKYTDDFGNRKKMGLVIWKDRKPVYVLTTECNTAQF